MALSPQKVEARREKKQRQEAAALADYKKQMGIWNAYKQSCVKRPAPEPDTYNHILGKFGLPPAGEKGNQRPHSKNKTTQVYETISRFVCKYPMPKALFSVWTSHEEAAVNAVYNVPRRDMFLAIAGGASVYKVLSPNYYNITRATAHAFITGSIDKYSWNVNVWRAKIEIICGGKNKAYHRLVHWFIDSGKAERYPINQSWETILTIFSRDTDSVTANDFSDILDFLRVKLAEDPNWSLKGRTVRSLIKFSYDWHRFNKLGPTVKVEWEPSGKSRQFTLIHAFAGGNKQNIFWSVDEILDSETLRREGQKMGHCVGSYATLCKSGDSSIFSVKGYYVNNDVINKEYSYRATIELRQSRIVQSRMKYNAALDKATQGAVNWWAEQNGISKQRGCDW